VTQRVFRLAARDAADRRSGESEAVRDDRELSMLMRAELNALGQLLIRKGVFTAEEFPDQIHEEARLLCVGSTKLSFPALRPPTTD
jgi:hypothetical protein